MYQKIPLTYYYWENLFYNPVSCIFYVFIFLLLYNPTENNPFYKVMLCIFMFKKYLLLITTGRAHLTGQYHVFFMFFICPSTYWDWERHFDKVKIEKKTKKYNPSMFLELHSFNMFNFILPTIHILLILTSI